MEIRQSKRLLGKQRFKIETVSTKEPSPISVVAIPKYMECTFKVVINRSTWDTKKS